MERDPQTVRARALNRSSRSERKTIYVLAAIDLRELRVTEVENLHDGSKDGGLGLPAWPHSVDRNVLTFLLTTCCDSSEIVERAKAD